MLLYIICSIIVSNSSHQGKVHQHNYNGPDCIPISNPVIMDFSMKGEFINIIKFHPALMSKRLVGT